MDYSAARASMIETQVRTNDVHERRVVQAIGAIQRELFVPEAMRTFAYSERAIETSPGRWMWSPREFAKMVQAINVRQEDRVLVIAAGSGYSAAVLARLAGSVTALEGSAEQAAATKASLERAGVQDIEVVSGDLKAGWPKGAPFNAIWIDGAVEVIPDAWLSQLAESGRMAVVVRLSAMGRAYIYTSSGGRAASISPFEAAVPLLPGFEKAEGFEF